MDVEPFPLITIQGSARDRGLQYGEQAAERIEQTIAVYNDDFKQIGMDAVRRFARGFVERIGGYDPELIAEIGGIAEGSGRSIEDIVAINARTEILYGLMSANDAHEPLHDGCTAVAALPAATERHKVIHAQNWDWRDDCYSCVVVVRARLENGVSMLTMAEAGMLARCGINSAGIALTGNFLKCELDNADGGVPIPCVRRRVLSSPHLRGAIGEIVSAPRSFSNNMMVSHAGGTAINLETTPGPVFWVQSEDGLLVHANHFLSVGALSTVRDLSLEVTPDSLYRQQRVEDHLRGISPEIQWNDIRDALDDRFGAPFGVCREVTDGPGGQRVSTVATIIMDAANGTVCIAPRPFLATQYYEYSLTSSEIRQSDSFGMDRSDSSAA